MVGAITFVLYILYGRWVRGVKGDRFTIMVVFMASLIQIACLSSSLHRYKTFWLLLIKINWSNKIVKHRIRTFSIHLVLTLSSLQHPPILATWDKTLIPFWLKKSCTYLSSKYFKNTSIIFWLIKRHQYFFRAQVGPKLGNFGLVRLFYLIITFKS